MGTDFGKHTLVLCGGGLDSYVAAWDSQLTYPDDRTVLMYVDYGAKAKHKELGATHQLRDEMNAYFGSETASLLQITGFSFFSRYTRSPLTDDGTLINAKPRAGVASEWVPARNTVLMSLAVALAENERFARIVTGINKTAAQAYPDNDQRWLYRWERLLEFAVLPGHYIELEAPVGTLEKHEIVTHGISNKMTPVLLAQSWSCYAGGKLHCGKCSSCRARREAFRKAEVEDLTEYDLDLIERHTTR